MPSMIFSHTKFHIYFKKWVERLAAFQKEKEKLRLDYKRFHTTEETHP